MDFNGRILNGKYFLIKIHCRLLACLCSKDRIQHGFAIKCALRTKKINSRNENNGRFHLTLSKLTICL